MKILYFSVISSLFLSSCSNLYHEEISFCFNSKDDAKNIGRYMMDNAFTNRTRYWLDGQYKGIEGLGFSWDGFKPDGSCLYNQFQLKITYEPMNKPEFKSKKIINAALLTYKLMRKEYNAL